jgi:L-arabinose isomerase
MILEEWLKAAGVAKNLAHSRLGLMGHYYSGMLDIATDLVQVSGRFGAHIEIVEVDQLSALRRKVTAEQLAQKLKDFHDFFAIDEDCPAAELERAAITAAALDMMVEERALNMMAYYYMGSGIKENEDTMSSVILGASLLTGRGVTLAGEYEIKNVLAMKILDLLGAGGSFTEYYTIDFKDDLVLMGHDGPGHIGIAQDKIRVRPLKVYHGKVGNGLSVEMTVKHGLVTLLSIMEDKQYGFSLLVAEGESVEGPILEIGNTNSRYRFSLGSRGFTEAWNARGPAHHCAIGVGHLSSQLRKVAELMNLGFHQIC